MFWLIRQWWGWWVYLQGIPPIYGFSSGGYHECCGQKGTNFYKETQKEPPLSLWASEGEKMPVRVPRKRLRIFVRRKAAKGVPRTN